MAAPAPVLNATVDTTTTPPRLIVVCNFRSLEGTARVAGSIVPFSGTLPVEIDDPDATWDLVSDDGTTAVYQLA